jgi:DNA polymerase III alpha subunit
MAMLNFLGLEMGECYTVIKKISKKKFKEKELTELQKILSENWIKKIGNLDNFNKVWQVMYDSARYGFNSPHAYSMAGDSLYEAWFKGHYPLKFYEVTCNHYSEKKDKDKVADLIKEMKTMGINFGTYKYGNNNTAFVGDETSNTLYPSMASLKDMSQDFANQLWENSQKTEKPTHLYDLFKLIYSLESANKTKIQVLVDIDYFSDYCNVIQAHRLNKVFYEWDGKKTIKKENLCKCPFSVELISKYSKETDKQYNNCDMTSILREYFDLVLDNVTDEIVVLEVNQSQPNFNPRVTVIKTKSNTTKDIRIYVNEYNEKPIKKYDSIKLLSKKTKPKSKQIDGKWVKFPDELETWVSYEVVVHA